MTVRLLPDGQFEESCACGRITSVWHRDPREFRYYRDSYCGECMPRDGERPKMLRKDWH